MKLTKIIFAAAIFFSSSVPAMAAQKVKNCGLGAENVVKDSLDFLHDNIESIMDRVSDLTTAEKRRLRNKVDSVNIKCMDHRAVCKSATRGGVSRHLFNAAVVVCYNNIRDTFNNGAFCKLTDVIFHEIAHAANVQKGHGHNQGANNDRVYRTGLAAGAECRVDGQNGSIVRNTND